MKAVVDTNVLVSGVLSPRGAPAQILEAWREGRFQIVSSAPLVEELRRVLARPSIAGRLGWSPDQRRQFVSYFEESVLLVAPDPAIEAVLRDTADNRVIEAAVSGQADYVVSGDRDLLDVGTYEGIPIVTPARFLIVLATP
jgi:uncharacterized protein